MTGSLSALEAARILGVSERMVRRLVQSGKLTVTQDKPLRLDQDSVDAERKRRDRRAGRAARDAVAVAPLNVEQLEALVRSAVAQALQQSLKPAIESREAIERNLAAELSRLAQERDALAQQLRQEQLRYSAEQERIAEQLAALNEALAQRRRWWSR